MWVCDDGVKDTTSGKIASHTYASHTYASHDSFDVTLRLTDNAGHTVSLTKKIKLK